MSILFCWPYSMSICLFICLPRSVIIDVRPFSVGDATFLFICCPDLSLVVSAPGHVAFLIHLSPRSVIVGVRPFPLAHVASLFICLPGLSLLASVLFHWPCRISVHLSPKCVIVGVRPFPLAMQHVYSFPK